MAISAEVKQIILILEEEGFGALAGELLTEISLGKEVEREIYSKDLAEQSQEGETAIARVPIDEPDQLFQAMNILRARLVLPVRAFVEAEKIASELVEKGNVRIQLVAPDERFEAPPISMREVGDTSVADELDALLERLPTMIAPRLTDGV